MNDDNSGAGQGALPPREGASPWAEAERPALRLTHVPGGGVGGAAQFVLATQQHSMPALAQVPTQIPYSDLTQITLILCILTNKFGPSNLGFISNESQVQFLSFFFEIRPQLAVFLLP